MKSISTLFRQLSLIVVLISAFSLSALSAVYEKVTTAPSDWSGQYLIVYETGNVAFDGSRTTLDAVSNTKSITISNNQISVDTDNFYFTIAKSGSNYTIKSASGYYIGRTATSNGLNSSTSTQYTHTLSITSSNVTITASGSCTLMFNSTKDQLRFRYFKSDQQAIQLYKLIKDSDSETPEPTQLATPTGLNATDITFSSFTVNWSAVENATEYTVIVTANSKSKSQTVTTTSCTFSGLNPNTEYEYTVVAKGNGVNYSDSEAASATVTTAEQPTYNVTLYNGDTQYGEVLNGSTVNLPTTDPTPSTACQSAGWEFAGWSTTKITEDATSATLLTGTYTPTADTTLYAVYKLEKTSSTGSAEEWALTDIANISATDEVVITMTYTDGTIYALSSSNGTSSAPTASTLTALNNNLSKTPADDLVWNISTKDGSYTIYPNGTTETWLYCINDNNGVRVGTNTNKTFTIDPTSGYLKNTVTSRYLGVYRTNPDWRCYTNTTGNTANQTLGFYVRTGGSQTTITYNSNPKCAVKEQLATPSLISSNISKHGFTISWNAIDNADSYTIKIDNEIITTTETSYTATELSANTTYTCSVTATDSQDNYYASEEATIDVTTLPLDKYTITWNTNGEIETTEYEEESTLELPSPNIASVTYCNFAGWYTEPTIGSNLNPSQTPTGEKVTSATKPTGNVTYYAVYDNSKLEEKVTSNLTDGTYYIRTEDGIYYTGKVSEEKYGGYSSNVADATEITVTTSESNFAIFDGTYWLYSPQSNNEIEFSDELKTDWTLTNEGKINSINHTARYLQYNATSPRFACYKGTQKDAFLYKKGTEATAYFSTIEEEFIINNNNITTIEHNTHVNSLTLYVDKTPNTQLKVTKTITADKVTIIQTIDASRWFFFSLPFDCNISDIVATDADGNSLTYDKHYVISKYNQTRAEGKDKAWEELLGTELKLNANQGYIIGHWYDKSDSIIVKFPSTKAQTISAPADKTLNYTDTWLVNGENSSKGFNLIGMPYYQKINSTISCDSVYIYSTTPNKDGKTYTQEEYTGNNVAPFTSFFVQVAENTAPTFTIAKTQSAAPMLRAKDVVAKATITLADANGGADETTVINNPTKTTDYEIGHDLVKWIGYAEIPQIYSIQGEDILAFNSLAMNNETIIPLGVYAHADGDYTFSLSDKSMGNLEGWELYDSESGKAVALTDESLTVTLSKGTHEGRFSIRMEQGTTTDCECDMSNIVTYMNNGTFYIENMPAKAMVYIYDAVGRMIYATETTDTSFDYTFALRGVYNVVVCTEYNSIAYKTIY